MTERSLDELGPVDYVVVDLPLAAPRWLEAVLQHTDQLLLVSQLNERVTVDSQSYPLSSNEYADGTVDPRGFERMNQMPYSEAKALVAARV